MRIRIATTEPTPDQLARRIAAATVLLGSVAVRVDQMRQFGASLDLDAVRRDTLRAARLLSSGTNVSQPLHTWMGRATIDALDAANALLKASQALQLIDNGLAQGVAQSSLGTAARSVDRALLNARQGKLP